MNIRKDKSPSCNANHKDEDHHTIESEISITSEKPSMIPIRVVDSKIKKNTLLAL
jgi:hypothetical protein